MRARCARLSSGDPSPVGRGSTGVFEQQGGMGRATGGKVGWREQGRPRRDCIVQLAGEWGANGQGMPWRRGRRELITYCK